jgi:hypothetical protein
METNLQKKGITLLLMGDPNSIGNYDKGERERKTGEGMTRAKTFLF